jgi:CheY-like chemotaxis protein
MNTQTAHSSKPTQPVTYGSTLASGTLLLIEDSRLVADTIRMMFQGAGGRLRRVDTLAQARRHLDLYTPDAVLVDMVLPDGSGLDLLAHLARRRPRVPLIVAMSGMADLRSAALAAGADVFLPKPIASLSTFRTTLAPVFHGLRMTKGQDGTPPQASPAALRDDLHLALDLLCGTPDAEKMEFALQFSAGIAQALHDSALAQAVTEVRQTGLRTTLVAMLRARLHGQRVI